MKSLFHKVAALFGVLIAISVIWICICKSIFPSIRRFDMASWIVSCWAAVGTISAVGMALFGKSIIAHFNKPKLVLYVGRDGSHCYFKEAPQMEPGVKVSMLEIYGHVVNEMSTPAQHCHVMTNVAYVSTNGQGDYTPEYEFCTASFKWANSRYYETTINRDMERYLKLFEIVEKVTDKQNSPDNSASTKKERVILMRLCVPSHGASTECVEIGNGYKGVMFPVRLACDEIGSEVAYIKIIWQGDRLTNYKVADKLKIEKLSAEEAKKIMAKKGGHI